MSAEDKESGGEKSEAPTGRRITEARNDGMVGKSVELSQVLSVTTAFVLLQHFSPMLWETIVKMTVGSLTSRYYHVPLTMSTLNGEFRGLVYSLLPAIMVFMVIVAFFGVGMTMVQTNFLWSNKLLKPKFSNLNPIKGLRRIFSMQNTFNLFKSLAKLAIICPIAYYAFMELLPEFLGLMGIPITRLMPYTAYAADYVFWRIIKLLLILAIADFCWQKFSTRRNLKMTKQQIKDEKKSIDGDEATRMRIRSKALSRTRERMLQSVPKADVIVTNPTHIAVALSYSAEPGVAPKVLAKGQSHLAERIKEIGRKHNIPVLERKSLARALYKSVEVNQEIPYELYQAVAELLAYVYKLKGKNPLRKKNASQVTVGKR